MSSWLSRFSVSLFLVVASFSSLLGDRCAWLKLLCCAPWDLRIFMSYPESLFLTSSNSNKLSCHLSQKFRSVQRWEQRIIQRQIFLSSDFPYDLIYKWRQKAIIRLVVQTIEMTLWSISRHLRSVNFTFVIKLYLFDLKLQSVWLWSTTWKNKTILRGAVDVVKINDLKHTVKALLSPSLH